MGNKPTRTRAMASVILCAGGLLANPAAAAGFACPVVAPPLAPPSDVGQTATLSAAQVTLANGVATAIGDVRIEQKYQALEAPRLSYKRETARVLARQGLKYRRPGLYLTAESARVQLDTHTGHFTGTEYTLQTNGGRGEAAQVRALGGGRYVLSNASYTTCVGATKAWLLSADRIELNRKTGRGEAYDTVLKFYGIPVFYSPYLNFPIDDKRHSGLLTPTLGYSSDSGFELAVPYYFNLAPNYDATLVPRLLSERGVQLAGEFRYLTSHHRGQVDAAWLPDDQQYGNTRWLLHFQHVGTLNSTVGIEAHFTGVSDDDYFDDLSQDMADAARSHLERSLRLTYAVPGGQLSMLAQGFQNLDTFAYAPGTYSNVPYERVPQIRLQLASPTAPFAAGLDAEFTAFENSAGIDAQRTDIRPHLNWRVDRGSWYAHSELAWRYTYYDFTENDGDTNQPRDSISRQIPSFSLGGGLRFVRTLDNGWLQTLEPRAFYLYKGYEQQSDIPLFDSGVPTLHFERLFARQRFIGADRIVDANQLTLGVSSRLIAPDSGRTVLKLDFGRIFAFDDPRVQWPGSVETGFNNGGSDYVAAVTWRPTNHFSTQLVAQYDPDDQALDRAIARVGYHNDAGVRINLAWRRYEDFRTLRPTDIYGNTHFANSQAETLERTGIGLALPLGSRVDFIGRWNYSLEKSRSVEILAGLEFRPSCCWAARLSWRRYIADDNGNYDNALTIQFVLRGLGAFGNTASSLVDNNVFDDDLARSSFNTISFP